MTQFAHETRIKAVRKRQLCSACDKYIKVGEGAQKWAGKFDGQFSSLYYHHDCRAAEIGLNALRDYRYGDEWVGLGEAESDDYAWLKANHPTPYKRMFMSREQWDAEPMTMPTEGEMK